MPHRGWAGDASSRPGVYGPDDSRSRRSDRSGRSDARFEADARQRSPIAYDRAFAPCREPGYGRSATRSSDRLTPQADHAYNEVAMLRYGRPWLGGVADSAADSASAGKDLDEHGCEFRAIAGRRPVVPGVPSLPASRMVRHPGVPPGRAPGWGADLRIIEGGHAVLFRSGPVCLAEILSGPETVLPEPGLALPLPPPPRTIHPPPARGPDRVSELRGCRAGRPRDLPPPLRGDDPRRRRARPSSIASDPPTAWPRRRSAHLHIDVRASGLAIQSFHTFPDECAIVRTQSLFELTSSLSKR